MRAMADWPRHCEAAARKRASRIRSAFYLHDLASAFHAHWNKGKELPQLRFIRPDDMRLSRARLGLVTAVGYRAEVRTASSWCRGARGNVLECGAEHRERSGKLDRGPIVWLIAIRKRSDLRAGVRAAQLRRGGGSAGRARAHRQRGRRLRRQPAGEGEGASREEPIDRNAFSADLEAELLQELELSFSSRSAPAAPARVVPHPAPAPLPADDADDLLRSIEAQLGEFERRAQAGRPVPAEPVRTEPSFETSAEKGAARRICRGWSRREASLRRAARKSLARRPRLRPHHEFLRCARSSGMKRRPGA